MRPKVILNLGEKNMKKSVKNKHTEIVFVKKNEPFTNSKIIAEGTGILHRNCQGTSKIGR
jgi:hypothetical protein